MLQQYDDQEKGTSGTADVHHLPPNPPPVPTTRGPPLPRRERTPIGPPHGTPKRWSARYSTSMRYVGEGHPLPTSEASPPAGSGVQRSGKYAVKGAAPLVPSAPSPTPENKEFFWCLHSDVPASTSLSFRIEGGASVMRDESSSVALGVMGSPEATRVSLTPLRTWEGQGREKGEGSRRDPEVQEGALHTSDGISRNSRIFGSYFNGSRNSQNYDYDDDMESLPAALPPPPTPYPTALPEPMSRFGKTATRLELGVKPTTGIIGKGGAKGNGVRGGTVLEARKTKPTAKPLTFRHVELTPPPPVLQPPVRSVLNEVNAWIGMMLCVEDTNFHKRYLQDSDRAFRDVQRETEVLLAEDAMTEKRLREAKNRYVDNLDECDRLRTELLEKERISTMSEHESHVIEENKRRRGEEEGKYAEEIEAWRIEKGELLAQKALLLQRRSELAHHLRRGTNIKNVAAMARHQQTPPERVDQNDSSLPVPDDIEIVQMRLEVKESQVCFEKLVDVHRRLKETQRMRQQEFEDECSTLRQAAAEARQSTETWRRALQTSLSEADRLRVMYQRESEDSLVLLLERGVEEARVSLKQNDSGSVLGDSIRSRGAGMTRCSSINSTPRRGAGSVTSTPTTTTLRHRFN